MRPTPRFIPLLLGLLLATACGNEESVGPRVLSHGPEFSASGTPGANGTAICANCHSMITGAVLTIAGPQSVSPGTVNRYTATITGGPAVVGGIDIAATRGTLTSLPGQGTKLLSGEIVHSTPKSFASGSVSWAFDWTAPSSSGPVQLFGAGNSADGNAKAGGDAGDGATTFNVTVQSGGNQPPVARWTSSCTTAHACTFDGTGSTDPDGTIVAYAWAIPSGKVVSTKASFSHTFPSAKTFSFTLTVTDNGGLTGSKTRTVVVPRTKEG